MLRGRTVDELHDDLVLHEIDVIQNRHRDPGGSGFRHEARLMTDSRPAQLVVEDVEAVRLRPPIFLDGGPSEEFRRSELRLRALLCEHAARFEAAEKKPLWGRAGIS